MLTGARDATIVPLRHALGKGGAGSRKRFVMNQCHLAYFDLEGGPPGPRVVSVVPQSLLWAAVAPDTGSAAFSYCMDAAAMSLELHDCGIHAV